MSQSQTPFGIYIHWPFCEAKCPYCDFNSHVRHKPVDQKRFVEAYKRELDFMLRHTDHLTVSSVFLGGGTPSLMEPETVADILSHIRQNWQVSKTCEITLEANPSSVEAARFEGYAKAGVNRVSLGVQSLRDRDLKALGRLHDVNQALKAIDIAKTHFQRVSIDLIYARSGQTLDNWKSELKEAVELQCDHYSLYQLTIEPETPFERLYNLGKLPMPDDDRAAEFYAYTQKTMADAGLPAYEVSNHARIGQEARHNLLYWRYGLYAGVGAGAQGRLPHPQGRLATSTLYNPEQWLESVEEKGHGLRESDLTDPTSMADEMLLMGLRLREGLSLKHFEETTHHRLDFQTIHHLRDDDFIMLSDDGFLSVTHKGRFVMNSVVAELSKTIISIPSHSEHQASPSRDADPRQGQSFAR
jgi:putative oxygen-independent coproporphyrinogen III oxidase